MDIFDVLSLIGGLSLFLFGMHIMGQALERRAGDSLRSLLGKLTDRRAAGFLTGLLITAVIQSSSATTVMVVGFVNSGLMQLSQAVNVIMGANVGTTITAWVLSLSGIESSNLFVQLLKPTSFTPILALIGTVYLLFFSSSKKKDTGTILLGFATLMFGMDTMSGAVSGLRDVPQFQQLFLAFQSPLLGMLAGAVLTAIIQSSSASVGILQSLALTGQVTYGAAIPIIIGQNIGTCVTAVISSFGANRNAKRAALVHLCFNVIGAATWLAVFWLMKLVLAPQFLSESASLFGIAAAHTVFNVLCTVLLVPMAGILERLVTRLVPDAKTPEHYSELDERLLATPSVALMRCREMTQQMAVEVMSGLREGLRSLKDPSQQKANGIRKIEQDADHYEDILGTYLVRLSAMPISREDSSRAAAYLKAIGDLERIADHSVNLLEAAEELQEKKLTLSDAGQGELEVLLKAVGEITALSLSALQTEDLSTALKIEPLEEVISRLAEQIRSRHILRLQQGVCSIATGFIFSDILTSLGRVAGHSANLAGCIIGLHDQNQNGHESSRLRKMDDPEFHRLYAAYAQQYRLP